MAFRPKHSIIPPSFDWQYYCRHNHLSLDEEEAYRHFINVGKQQGMNGSPCCDQGYFVRLIHRLSPSSILEIGPGASPRFSGDNVFYFDVKTEMQLYDRYKNESDVTIPQRIHYVDKDGDLGIIDRQFDIVFSSHVIEHTADFVTHLNHVGSLLNEGGFYFLDSTLKCNSDWLEQEASCGTISTS